MSAKETKVRGIVIREAPMGDKDKRIVLLTEEMGKVSVLCKGALGPKSKFAVLSQLFSVVEMVITKGRTFYYIKEGRLLESLYDLRLSLEKLTYATLMAEVADTFCLDGQENRGLLRLLYRGLKAEAKAREGMESLPANVFMLRCLSDNGFYPSLETCLMCGKDLLGPVNEEESAVIDRVLFDARQGGVICPSCREADTVSGLWIGMGTLRAMQYIVQSPAAKVYSFTVTEEILTQLDLVVREYLKEQTERKYQGFEFLDQLRKPM